MHLSPFHQFRYAEVSTRMYNEYESFVLIEIVASRCLRRTLFNLKTVLTLELLHLDKQRGVSVQR